MGIPARIIKTNPNSNRYTCSENCQAINAVARAAPTDIIVNVSIKTLTATTVASTLFTA